MHSIRISRVFTVSMFYCISIFYYLASLPPRAPEIQDSACAILPSDDTCTMLYLNVNRNLLQLQVYTVVCYRKYKFLFLFYSYTVYILHNILYWSFLGDFKGTVSEDFDSFFLLQLHLGPWLIIKRTVLFLLKYLTQRKVYLSQTF